MAPMVKLEVFIAYPHQPFAVEEYTIALKDSCVDLKFSGEQITSLSTLENALEGIRNADITLFDITGWNQNVASTSMWMAAVRLSRRRTWCTS